MVPRAIKEAALLLGGLEAEGKQRLCKNPAVGGGGQHVAMSLYRK
jgi:hypothetical protein